MNVGLLTGGGDCPGLNAVIRAIVQRIDNAGGECIGLLEGWRGLVESLHRPLSTAETDGIIAIGGTILGSSRTNPFKKPDEDLPRLRANFDALKLDALIAIGGDDTLGVANRLHKQFGMPMVGIPKTIDNDLDATDFTFGFDTAINVVTEAIDRLRTTAESHRRVMVIETMGRHAGWIACFAGIASAADYVFVPEVPINLNHCVEVLKHRRIEGKNYGLIVVAEGAEFPNRGLTTMHTETDAFGHVRLGGVGNAIAKMIEEQTGIETRAVILGHLQRGGPPSAYDRVLATRMGIAAADLVLQKEFGTMVALRGRQIVTVGLEASLAGTKNLDLDHYREASVFFQ